MSGSKGLEMSWIDQTGSQPDYDSGPYLSLMAAVVKLARLDLADPLYSEECTSFLTGDLAELFAECLHYEGSWLDA